MARKSGADSFTDAECKRTLQLRDMLGLSPSEFYRRFSAHCPCNEVYFSRYTTLTGKRNRLASHIRGAFAQTFRVEYRIFDAYLKTGSLDVILPIATAAQTIALTEDRSYLPVVREYVRVSNN